MARHHPGIQMIAEVMRLSGQPLRMLLFFNVIFIVLLGSIMYYVEVQAFSVAPKFTKNDFPTGVYVRKDAQYKDDEVSPFKSIPYGFWYVCVTMTTVGYGDFSPTTPAGKVIGVLIFYIGILFLALPIGVLSSNFEMVYNKYTPQTETVATKKRFKTIAKTTLMQTDGKNWFPHTGSKRRNVFLLLHEPASGKISRAVQYAMVAVIFVSIIAFVLETVPDYRSTPSACTPTHLSVENCMPVPDDSFYMLEVVCIAIFTFDYVTRIGLVHAADASDVGLNDEQLSARFPRLSLTAKYCCQHLNLVDFFAVAPFYLELVVGENKDWAIVRVLRLIRLFRLLKSPRLRLTAEMFRNITVDAMPALMTLFFLTTLMCVLFASCMVYAETSKYSVDEFPDEYPTGTYIRPTASGIGSEASPYTSIPYAFWWFFVTTTTVGYGDDYPTTTMGRAIAIATFYLGIVLLALPLSIVSQSFNKFYPQWVKTFQKLDKTSNLGLKKDLRSVASAPTAVPGSDQLLPPELDLSKVLECSSDVQAIHTGDASAIQVPGRGEGSLSPKPAWG